MPFNMYLSTTDATTYFFFWQKSRTLFNEVSAAIILIYLY